MAFDGRPHPSWEVAGGNSGRARRRMLRPEFMRGDMKLDPASVILHAPSDDKDPPVLPSCALALRPPVDSPESPIGFGFG